MFGVYRVRKYHPRMSVIIKLRTSTQTLTFHSRSMVQFPGYEIFGCQWVLWFLGLVWWSNMASSRSCNWRNSLPWSHGNQRCYLPCSPSSYYSGRYSKYLCASCARIFRLDSICDLPIHEWDVHFSFRWLTRRNFHGHCSRLYLPISCWQLR